MRIAIITASVGGIDEVVKPVEQNTKYDYYLFTEYNLPFPLPNLDNRLKSKYIKAQLHRFLPEYDIYIWIDGRIKVVSDTFVEHFVQQLQNQDVVVVNHNERKNVFEEIEYILDFIKKGNHYLCSRYENQQLEKELEFYNENNVHLKNVALYAGGIWARWNNKKINSCFDEWWRRILEFSYFDQTMLAYVLGESKLKLKALDWNDVFEDFVILGKHTMDNINFSYEDVYLLIKDHLRRQVPLSVLRYGDGEAMLLDKDLDVSQEYKDHVFKRQLGNGVTDLQKQEIIDHLSYAYLNSEVIGIPTVRHERKEGYWGKAFGILNDRLKDRKDFCSIDLHFDFLNNQIFDKLLTDRENLFYISSSNLDQQLKDRFNIKNIYSYIIAPEMKFSPDYNGIKHYPDHFNKVRDWIDSVGCRGELCLVGGGVVGKLYNVWFKERGGISVDIGSVFDNWAGKLTRGVDRGANKTDNEHKL